MGTHGAPSAMNRAPQCSEEPMKVSDPFDAAFYGFVGSGYGVSDGCSEEPVVGAHEFDPVLGVDVEALEDFDAFVHADVRSPWPVNCALHVAITRYYPSMSRRKCMSGRFGKPSLMRSVQIADLIQ